MKLSTFVVLTALVLFTTNVLIPTIVIRAALVALLGRDISFIAVMVLWVALRYAIAGGTKVTVKR